MPSFNPSKLLCCCKIPKRRKNNSESIANGVALQPIPVVAPPAEEEHQEPSEKNRQSIIGLPNTAWAIPVRNSSFESGSIIRQYVDDDDSDSDQDRAQPTKKSSTALDTVRNKLIRTISHSSNGDHPSHVSVGNSEEEIARRAELKRIMHQRIQDELKSDESDDQIESKPTNNIQRIASVVDVTLSNSGPRDAIEFGVSKSSRNGHSTQLNSDQVDQDMHQDSGVSQPGENKPQKAFSQTSELIHGADEWRQDDVHPRVSPSYPKRHVSACEGGDFTHSQKSFQLSNGTGRLDRILGPDSSFNSRHASSGDGHSALGVWLIAQGLRSRDNSTLFLDEEDELEPTEDTKLTDYNTTSLRRAEGDCVQETRETPANGNPNIPHEPTIINIPNTVETYSPANFKANNDRHEISSLSGELPWGTTVTALINSFTDHTSSSDPSKSQPSPMRSQNNLYKLDPKDLDSMELSPFKWRSHTSSQDRENANDQNSKSVNIGMPQIKSQSHGNIHHVEFPVKALQDTTSLAQSESASFLQLEAELGSAYLEYPEMGIRPSESGYTELQALGREISNMKGEPHLHVPGRELSKPQSSRSLGDRVVALMHDAIGQRHWKHDDVVEVAEDPTIPLTPSVVRESIAATDIFVTPRSRFSNDAKDGEARTSTEAESDKVKGQKTQLKLPEGSKNAPPSNSSTSIKGVEPHARL
ncbi:hypothetical protein FVER53590_11499 [Fusarium verticillioides]|nr:hypothetical protein FVER53590_11499 [Fusarium verticillioides]